MCVLKKGYQDTDTVLSSVTTKVKGIALTNTTELGERIWDVADYIIPPQVVRRFDEEEVQARRFKWPLTTGATTTVMGYEEKMATPACSYIVLCSLFSLHKGCVQSFGINIHWFEQFLLGNHGGLNKFALTILNQWFSTFLGPKPIQTCHSQYSKALYTGYDISHMLKR